MKKIIIISAAAVIIGCILGYVVGYFRGSKDVTASYAVKIAAVNKLFPMSPTTNLFLSGRVKNISGNIVTIDANPSTLNPFTQGNFPAVREVMVVSATVITRMEQTDPAVFQKEIAAFQKATQGISVSTGTALSAVTPPTPFSEIGIKLSDIKVGDTVTVTAASDISSAVSFEAAKIEIMPGAPTMQATPTPASVVSSTVSSSTNRVVSSTIHF